MVPEPKIIECVKNLQISKKVIDFIKKTIENRKVELATEFKI